MFFLTKISSVKKFDSDESAQTKKVTEIKRKQLAALLAKPIFPKGISAYYSLMSATALPIVQAKLKEERAIDVMKSAMDNSVKEKKHIRKVRLYKPNKRREHKETSIGKIQAGKSRRKEKTNWKKKFHKKK